MRAIILACLVALPVCAADIVLYSTTAPATATGTATNSDVLIGVTYSSAAGTGLTGTRYPAPVPKTGQTTSYATGDDGDLEKGVVWPNPRFTIQANTNAVLDNLTGLVWTRSANMAANTVWSDSVGTSTWANAFAVATNANGLAYGGRADWRVPNIRELFSVMDTHFEGPSLCNTTGTAQWTEGVPFFSVKSAYYWSSSTRAASGAVNALVFTLQLFTATVIAKTGSSPYVWLCAGPD